MVFRSAVDWWYYLVAAGVPAVTLYGAWSIVAAGLTATLWFAIALLSLSAILPVWLLLATSYRADSGTLVIRSGPFSWTIPLDQIQSVRPSRSVLSSPALSLDRLEIRYGQGRRILVSPRDRRGFLEAVGQSAPPPA